jgi:Bacterial Ig-like domain/Bacterial Ig domain
MSRTDHTREKKGKRNMVRILPTTWWARAKALALAGLLAAVLAGLAISPAQAIATTFTVTNTNDSGAGSLRQAITDANDNANPAEVDTITFDIPADDPMCNDSGVCTISPTSNLPEITQAVIIDGYSQPGASPNTLETGSNAVLKIELSRPVPTDVPDDTRGLTITGPNSVVRGLIINRWGDDGITVRGSGASGNRIEGNYIGTDASGTSDLGNGRYGVRIDEAQNNVVGGTSPGARNVLSGNGAGVFIGGVEASGNRIEGNYIGTDATGDADLGNSHVGVGIGSSPNNLVGGIAARAGNVISGNDEEGVSVEGSAARGNRILRNSIFDNGRLGIDLLADGGDVTANDISDPDIGPNDLQNFPIITSVTTFGSQTTIQGTFNSTTEDTFNLQFFSNPAADPSGFGEGETYVGQTNVLTNFKGNDAFSFATNTPISVGRVVTATATNTVTLHTSEFSEAVEVEGGTPPPPPAPQCSDGADNDMDGKIDFGGTNGDPGCSSATDDSESPDPSDTTAPEAPLIISPANNSHNNAGIVTISGMAEAGSTVKVVDNAGLPSEETTQAAADGSWSVTFGTSSARLADASYTFTATATDAAGNTSGASGPVTVIVDKTPPTVVRVDPFNGQQGVPLGTNVTVIFSERMDEATLNDNTVRLLRPGRKPASVPVAMTKGTDASGKTILTLDPFGSTRQTLAASTAYQLTIEGAGDGDNFAVKDLTGNELAPDEVSSFTAAKK